VSDSLIAYNVFLFLFSINRGDDSNMRIASNSRKISNSSNVGNSSFTSNSREDSNVTTGTTKKQIRHQIRDTTNVEITSSRRDVSSSRGISNIRDSSYNKITRSSTQVRTAAVAAVKV
jgi:hypothetical protein